nr:tetratricopeptide repeat protein [uncultured Fluviicola sp.]
MKLFGFLKKKNKDFPLSENDQQWVAENFSWLVQVFGYPDVKKGQITLTESFFPETFRAERVEVSNILKDLTNLLEIPKNKVEFDIHEDFRDIYGMPLAVVGKTLETELEELEEGYKIHIANQIQKHPKRLIYRLIYECVRIKLIENEIPFDTGEDTEMFIYLAGIYFGFGVILTQNLRETGISNDGAWETSWSFSSPMPDETIVFGLAFYSKLGQQDSPAWSENLRSDLKKLFEQAIDFLTKTMSPHFSKELMANRLFSLAHVQYKRKKNEDAFSSLGKALILTNNDLLKSDIHNNIGYYLLRSGQYNESIPHFREAIKLKPDYGYANDNLGYALIQTGALEEGKKWLEKAVQTKTNNDAYSFRNLALYYQKKGEPELAEENFHKAFKATEGSVDLLELHFAGFLFDQGRNQEALDYLKRAVEKGEPEAIQRMEELKRRN